MSYCVNCGVELEASLKRCPLCGTEIINPNERSVPDPAARPFPVSYTHLRAHET